MASQTPVGQLRQRRHRIANIQLQPSIAKYDISLKILVDEQEPRRLPAIQRGASLTWETALSCDVDLDSRVELRVYEKRLFRVKRIGTLHYTIATITNQAAISLELDTKQFTAVLSFPTSEEALHAPTTALAGAQAMEKKTRLLERLGSTRDAFKTILDFGGAVAEIHPAARMVFKVCNLAWQTLERQEQCDANVEKLVVGLASMLPLVELVKTAASLPQLRNTVETMMNLVEDASRFIVEYKSDAGPGLGAAIGSKPQAQVQDPLEKFQNLKEEFDRGVGIQTLEMVDAVHGTVDTVHETMGAVHEALTTTAQRTFLNELKPVGSARYDSARACLSGTRADIVKEIVDWSQQRDTSEGLLWVHGQAGLGKSSIATSVCQELDGRKLLAGEFFCKRDSSERRDPQQVLTTIVYGLAFRHTGYAKFVANAIKGDSRLCSSPIQMQYDNLVKSPLETLSQSLLPANLVLVVDALDECGTTESRRQLLAYLHLMSQLVPWLKVVVTSRPDPDIQGFFDHAATTGVSRRNVHKYDASNDIHSFIMQRIFHSLKSKYLPEDATRLLTERSAGLFIWAKTACELILNSHDPKSRFDLVIEERGLMQTSNPLDILYTTAIETSLGANDPDDTQYVQKYLGAVIVCSTRTPLSVASLSNLLADQMKENVLQSVVDSLGSVLYIDHDQGGVVRVYHNSFTDYITSSARSGRFCIDLGRQNTEFTRCCLQTMKTGLRFNICRLETSHISNSQVLGLSTRVDTAISLHLRYSCLYWTSHLSESQNGELADLLTTFLLRPTVLYWIEALSLLGRLDAAMFNALELSKSCQGFEELYQCARDMYRFILAYYDPISESTPHLYVSALAFCPTRTAFIRRLRPTFQNTLVIRRGVEKDWSPWLRCISHSAQVRATALSKNGQRIVSGSSDNKLRVWDADTGVALGKPLVGHLDDVNSVGFSPDGRLIVSGSDDKTVRVWDADTGALLGDPLVGHSDNVWSVGFSPDSRRIISSSLDNTVRMWDADTGAALGRPLAGHSRGVCSASFSPDSRLIVSSSDDKTIKLWDADTGAPIGNPLVGHSHNVCSVGFSPDSRRIVSGSLDNTVRLWDVSTGAAIGNPLIGHSRGVRSVGFSPDGRFIISSSEDKTVRVWSADTGTPLGDPLVGHLEHVLSAAFSPDGHHIISGSLDNTVRVWDVNTGTALSNPLVGHSGYVRSVGFSPDGCHIVSGSSDNTMRLWDADTGAALGKPLVGHSGGVRSVAFSPDGRLIVSGSDDSTVRVWSADTGAPLGDPLVGHSGCVWSVEFSPNSRYIASGSSDKMVRVWEVNTRAALGTPLIGHSDNVCSVRFSPDGRRIASGSDDSTVRVWNVDASALLGDPLVGHSGPVRSVGFSPDGRHIVSGSDDGTVRVWDIDAGALLGNPLVGHSGGVRSVGFSPDGRLIVSSSDDGTVRVWSADTGALVGDPFIGHSGCVWSVAFSPDGRRITSGSSDNTVRVWDSAPTHAINLPPNTSRMSNIHSGDGWVRDRTTGALLLWLPEEYRRQSVDDSLFVISNDTVPRPVPIDSSKFVHGQNWESIYTP